METRNKAACEARAAVFKALGHPTRLFIVEELSRGKRCFHELSEMLDVDKSTVSRHLLILKNAGVISDEKRGNKMIYSLNVPCVVNFFSCVDSVLQAVAERSYGAAR
jgi:DNA-binding transcriptional ArsR family regulator